MANATTKIETKLDQLLYKKAPPLPDKVREYLVDWLPTLALILALLKLLSVWSLWRWLHTITYLASYSIELCRNTGIPSCGSVVHNWSTWIILTIIVNLLSALLYFAAYAGLKARNKEGWNYMYYSGLLGVLYTILVLFSERSPGSSSALGSLIGTIVGLYLLFQIRNHYTLKQKRVPPTITG